MSEHAWHGDDPRICSVCYITQKDYVSRNAQIACIPHRSNIKNGQKDFSDKPRMDLVLPDFVLGLGRGMSEGLKSYDANSWQNVKHGQAKYQAAAMRHLLAIMLGEQIDPKSKLPHAYHLGCCAMILSGLQSSGKGDETIPCDDRACKFCYANGEVSD